MKKGRYYKTHYLGRRSSKEKKEIDAFLMDDSTLKTFQKNALRLFDLPHHPRRLRQAALKWKAWREKVLAHSSKKLINGLPSMLTSSKSASSGGGGGGEGGIGVGDPGSSNEKRRGRKCS